MSRVLGMKTLSSNSSNVVVLSMLKKRVACYCTPTKQTPEENEPNKSIKIIPIEEAMNDLKSKILSSSESALQITKSSPKSKPNIITRKLNLPKEDSTKDKCISSFNFSSSQARKGKASSDSSKTKWRTLRHVRPLSVKRDVKSLPHIRDTKQVFSSSNPLLTQVTTVSHHHPLQADIDNLRKDASISKTPRKLKSENSTHSNGNKIRALENSFQSAVNSEKSLEKNNNESVIDNDMVPKNKVAASGDGEMRVNEVGVQMLSNNLFKQIFQFETTELKSSEAPHKKQQLFHDCVRHLKNQGLWDKTNSKTEDIRLSLPKFHGNSISEHFRIIASEQCKPYHSLLQGLVQKDLPPIPKEFVFKEGWTKYFADGSHCAVEVPDADAVVFDVEVCVSEGSNPTMATAASTEHWYTWCSKRLVNIEEPCSTDKNAGLIFGNLIPFDGDNSSQTPRIIVGHNVAYDRIRVREQYYINNSKTRFVDTMSLHVAVGGLVHEQRAFMIAKDRKITLPWMSVGCLNNLNDVYQHYCKSGPLKKETRQTFVEGSMEEIRDDFQNLMAYCANDVVATHRVLVNLIFKFYECNPHPVTFSGILEMGCGYLPVNDNWTRYIELAEKEYISMQKLLNEQLMQQVFESCKLIENNMYTVDPWLWDLDWAIPMKFRKEGKKVPRWYHKLCKKNSTGEDESSGLENMSTSLKIVPKLLRLTWKGFPLHHEKGLGWGYLRPVYPSYQDFLSDEGNEVAEKYHAFPVKQFYAMCPNRRNFPVKMSEVEELEQLLYGATHSKPKKASLSDKQEGNPIDIDIPGVEFVRLPHKNGPGNNVGSPLAKDFLVKIEDGTLSSSIGEVAQTVTKTTKTIAYWRNARARIMSQSPVWIPENNLPEKCTSSEEYSADGCIGAILPQVVVCGTVTRRAVEPTWLTASNARKDRIGSELKAVITAPPGYHFVGADVDAQEQWIAALLGDSYFAGIHGCTAMSWMTLEGNKADGTDVHSQAAKTAQITRDQAKVINYGRMYGAGQKFLQTLLRQYTPSLSHEEAGKRAEHILSTTKGKRGWKLSGEGREAMKRVLGQETPSYRIYTKQEINALLKALSAQDPHHDHTFHSLTTGSTHWTQGSESHTFNCLEEIVRRDRPQSPVLGAVIPAPLQPLYVGDQFMTSRINWVVQSSAVDFLHIITVCMQWLAQLYAIDMRFAISIHDEVRYLVASEDRYRAALALQITNLLTRAFFAERVGMPDLPLSVAFFSSVDIDKVLRKDPQDPCITPSNPRGLRDTYGVEDGESLTIHQLLKKLDSLQ